MQQQQDTTTQFLGRDAADTPRLGLGLAALGRPGYINVGHSTDLKSTTTDVDSMQQHCWTILDAAWELGVAYFDAARSYGRAEEFLGSWLTSRGIPPDAVVVGSKWG
jgi:aryl-alcohol dehydrogenase-like predicted oxidoreductase